MPRMTNTQSNPIDNIVVLMLENRSFDNILGALYPHSSTFEGPDVASDLVEIFQTMLKGWSNSRWRVPD